MKEPDLDTVTRRLERLERDARWWKVFGSIAVGLLALVVLMGATTVADEVRATRFLLVDKAGKLRAGLGVRADGSPGLALFDKDGKVIWKAP